jgi:hypothetical protein
LNTANLLIGFCPKSPETAVLRKRQTSFAKSLTVNQKNASNTSFFQTNTTGSGLPDNDLSGIRRQLDDPIKAIKDTVSVFLDNSTSVQHLGKLSGLILPSPDNHTQK